MSCECLRPRERKEKSHVFAYQVALPVALVYKIACVCSTVVGIRILLPILLMRNVAAHHALELPNIHACTIDSIARTKKVVDVVDQLMEAVDQFELRGVCEEIADDLIDSFAGSGKADLMAEFAHPMPLRVMARLFGLGDDEAAKLGQDLTDTVASDDGVGAYQRIQDRMQRLVQRKKDEPGADLPSRLLVHPAGMTEEEILQDLLVVLTAAQQPVAYWIGNAIRLMLTDERFAVTLSGGRRSVGQALNEVLWEDTPTQNFIGRFASRETELGGQRIHTGDMLVLGFAAANTDPQVRPDAYSDSIGNNAHMSFGHGEHGCPHPGPEIGAVISRIAIEVLLDRLPDVVLAANPDALVWLPSVWMRGLQALPVQFSPSYTVSA